MGGWFSCLYADSQHLGSLMQKDLLKVGLRKGDMQ